MVNIGKLNRIEVVVFATLMMIVSLYIYVANDERQPLLGFFRLEYLIPCVIYSSFVMLVGLGVYQLVKVVIKKKSVALLVGLTAGVPFGIYVIFHLTNWLLR